MFGSLGLPELLFIFGLALLIFGPRKLPEIGRTIGRGLAEFRKASTDLKRSLNTEMIEEELRESDPRKALRDEPAGRASQPAAGSDRPGEESAGSEEAAEPSGSVSRGSIVAGSILEGSPKPAADSDVEAESGDAVNGTAEE